jgi:hypothetical protein
VGRPAVRIDLSDDERAALQALVRRHKTDQAHAKWAFRERTRWRTATFAKLRLAFMKIAVRIEEMKTRMRLSLPASYPQAPMLVALTGAITTAGP